MPSCAPPLSTAPTLPRRRRFEPPSTAGSNSWSELGLDTREHICDAGEVCLSGDANPRELIEASVAALLDKGACPIILGGDHSISYPILRAFHHGQGKLDILHIDAHPDLYDAFDGDRYSHACQFARIMEEGLANKLVQVGIRTMNGHQREQAERFCVEVITMREWVRGKRFDLRQPVYLSIDLDAIDPAFAPGVSHREPGGLSVRDVLDIIQNLSVQIIGADVVEYNPHQDLSSATAAVAAKLVKEIIGQVVRTTPTNASKPGGQ